MKALLLNSGMGSRMGHLTEKRPKCMCSIGNGYTIISWQLELLRRQGICDVVVTTGYLSTILEDYIQYLNTGLNLTFIYNPDFGTTNYIYSMLLANDCLKDEDILSLHGDLVLEPSVLTDLLQAKESVVTVDSTLPLPDKDFKATIQDKLITAVGVDLTGVNCVACQPAYKWMQRDFADFMKEIQNFCASGQTKVYAENAFNSISQSLPLYPMELGGRLCNEVDNAKDLGLITDRFQAVLRGVI